MAWIRTYMTKHGERYQVQWLDPNTDKVCYGKPQPYKSHANDLRKEKDLELANADSGMVLNIPNKITVREVYDIFFPVYKDSTPRPRSVEILRGSLKPFLDKFGSFQIQSISTPQLERFKNELLQNRVSNGVNFVIRYIKIYFAFAVKNGYLRNDPAKAIEQFNKKKVARFLTREELCRLYLSAPKKLRKAIFALVYTGLRIGEFVNTKKSDISERAVEIKGKSGNKTGGRFVPLPHKVRKIFVVAIGSYTVSAFEQSFHKAVARLNIGRIRPHDLRHTFASIYLQCGGTLRDLQLILGHKSLAMMEVYGHFQRAYLDDRMDAVKFPKPYKKPAVVFKVA